MTDARDEPRAASRGRKTLLISALLTAGLTFGPAMPAHALFGEESAAVIAFIQQTLMKWMQAQAKDRTQEVQKTTHDEGQQTRQQVRQSGDQVSNTIEKVQQRRENIAASDQAAQTPGSPQDADKASVAVAAATAASSVFNRSISFGREALDQQNLGNYTQRKVNEIDQAAGVAPGQSDTAAEAKITKLLTPEPMISGVAVRGKDSIFNPANARSDADVKAVVKALVGSSELPLVDKYALKTRQGQEAQAAIFTQFARQQLAASAVYPTFSKDTLNALNEEYKSYVLTPPQDLFKAGVGDSERLKMLIMLQQGTNDLLINLRVSMLEQNRLLGVLVAQQQAANSNIGRAVGVQ